MNGNTEDSSVVTNDEAAQTKELKSKSFWSGWFMLMFHNSNIFIIKYSCSWDSFDTGVIGNIWNKKGVDLSGWSSRNQKSQALGWNSLDGDLDFVRGVEITLGADWADLESIEESQGFPLGAFAFSGDEGDYLFSWDAGWESGWVDLIVSGLNEIGCFSEEVESDFNPSGISPVGSDDEWDNSVAIWINSFDGVEDIVSGSGFQMVDTYVILDIPIATLGVQSKGLVRV